MQIQDPLTALSYRQGSQAQSSDTGKTHEMRAPGVRNERTAGFMPQWQAAGSDLRADEQVEVQAEVQAGSKDGFGFGFGDMIDMINPLHHIPAIGHIYREISGDTIQPISKIIGGAAYGGVLGAAANVIDSIVIAQTGKDMISNTIDMAFHRREIHDGNGGIAQLQSLEQPERLDYDAANAVLAMADLSAPAPTNMKRNEDNAALRGLYALA